jgi:hypothetical protein
MAIQASGSLKGAGSDQTILGCRKPSIFPVANPPCRLSGKLSNIVSFVLGFEGRGKALAFDRIQVDALTRVVTAAAGMVKVGVASMGKPI